METLDTKIKMRVVPQVSGPKHGRRGQKPITKSVVLWCIEYETGGLFTFSYYRKIDAIRVMQLMKKYGTDTVRYRDFNVVKDISRTLHVWPME